MIMTPTLSATLAYFAGEVVNAVLWAGAVVLVLAAFTWALALCRAAKDGEVECDRARSDRQGERYV